MPLAKYETHMLQNRTEFNEFTRLLQKEGVKSYLEIGCKNGGTLWNVALKMPRGSTIVAVDLPQGDGSFKETQKNLEACVERLKREGYDAHLYLGDSTDQRIIDRVASHAIFDACFIDANHTLPYVKKDWQNYGQMCRIVAFHDIGWKPRPEPSKKMPIEVPIFWAEIKKQYRHVEFSYEPKDNGIGVLWRF